MTMNPLSTLDVFIIGGGISGAAIAAECAQKGLKVAVCGRGDVGGASSSHSDQILPGAFHFLKNHNLPFFSKALKEKSRLKEIAPHLCTERKFVVLSNNDTLGKFKDKFLLWFFRHWLVENNEELSSRKVNEGYLEPLQDTPKEAWMFQEQMVNDSRLVIENLLSVENHGGAVMPRCTCIEAQRSSGHWKVTIEHRDGSQQTLFSKALINAAGPWVNRVQSEVLNIETRCWVELKRKCFLVVPRFYSGPQAYILEDGDQQLSVCPYQQHYCLISLSNVTENDQNQNHITDEESLSILHRLNNHFKTQLGPDSILQSFATQQPLYTDDNHAQQNSVDDYALDMDCSDGHSPLVSVFGGSFATHRVMALETLQLLSPYLSFQSPLASNRATPLPGGDIGDISFEQFILETAEKFPWLPSHLLHHYCRTYGARSRVLLKGCSSLSDLGLELCPGLREKEAQFLCDYEWATSGDDILWRRTQSGLNANKEESERLNLWVEDYLRCKIPPQKGTIHLQFRSA